MTAGRIVLLELAAQGVRGVASGGSLRLRPGYNVVAGDGAALRRLVTALLQPDPSDAAALGAGGAAGTSARGGLTLNAADGATWRVVRDFAGASQLQQLDPSRRAFVALETDPARIAARLAALGIPTRDRLALATLAGDDLPSRRAGAARRATAAPPARAGPEREPSPDVAPRLAALRAELAVARVAAGRQARADALQRRVVQADEALHDRARLAEAEASAAAALTDQDRAAAALGALGELEPAIAAYRAAEQRRDEAAAAVGAEREALAAAAVPPVPPWRRASFWGGVGAGLAAIGAAAATGDRALALLDIPALGWSAWVALAWVSASEAHGRAARRLAQLADRERHAEEAWQREAQPVLRACGEVGAASVAELQDAAARLEAARRAAEAAAAERAAFEGSAATRAAERERDEARAELARLEEEGGGAWTRDPRSIEQELERLEAGEGEDPFALHEAGVAAGTGPSAPGPGAVGDPMAALVVGAAGVLGGSPGALALALAGPAGRALAALTGGRLDGFAAGERGTMTPTAGGRPQATVALAPADRDLVWLAVKLALAEHLVVEGAWLVLADDAFSGLPDGARRAAGRLLKALARGGQVLHGSSDVAFREAADHLA